MDRRVRRTRRALRESLISLISERGWDQVAVQHVCERADVGRSTFYAHFVDREDLLLSGFDELKQELRARSTRPLGFVGGLIEHVDAHRPLARLLMGRGGPPIRKRMTRMVVGLLEEELAALEVPPALRAPAAHFLGGALLDLLLWRLEPGVTLPAAELEALFYRLASPVLGEVLGKTERA